MRSSWPAASGSTSIRLTTARSAAAHGAAHSSRHHLSDAELKLGAASRAVFSLAAERVASGWRTARVRAPGGAGRAASRTERAARRLPFLLPAHSGVTAGCEDFFSASMSTCNICEYFVVSGVECLGVIFPRHAGLPAPLAVEGAALPTDVHDVEGLIPFHALKCSLLGPRSEIRIRDPRSDALLRS